MARSDFFLQAGFQREEASPPFELLVRKFATTAADPRLVVDRDLVLKKYPRGLTVLAADQCPMVPKWVDEISQAAWSLGLKPEVIPIRSAAESRQLPTPYGMFSLVYEGRLLAGRPVSATRFRNLMKQASPGV